MLCATHAKKHTVTVNVVKLHLQLDDSVLCSHLKPHSVKNLFSLPVQKCLLFTLRSPHADLITFLNNAATRVTMHKAIMASADLSTAHITKISI